MQGLESKLLKGVWNSCKFKSHVDDPRIKMAPTKPVCVHISLSHKHAMELCVFLANYSKTLLMQPLKDQGYKVILMRFPEEKITVFGCKVCDHNNEVLV